MLKLVDKDLIALKIVNYKRWLNAILVIKD